MIGLVLLAAAGLLVYGLLCYIRARIVGGSAGARRWRRAFMAAWRS